MRPDHLPKTLSLADSIELRDRSMSMRPATPADDPFLAFLNREERGAAYAGLALPDVLLEKMLATHLHAQTATCLAQYRSAECLIVCHEGEPIGRLWLTLEIYASGRCLRLIDLVLRENMQARGIGRDLLCSLVDSARAMRLARVTLSIFAGNKRAIKLCQRIGFRLQGGADEFANVAMIYPLS